MIYVIYAGCGLGFVKTLMMFIDYGAICEGLIPMFMQGK